MLKIRHNQRVINKSMYLAQFAPTWDEKYPQISESWWASWPNLIAIYDYPTEIRRMIYTTNAIESLNSVVRKSTRNRKVFPNDQSAMKVVYLGCGGLKEMDDADTGLEASVVSVYYQLP